MAAALLSPTSSLLRSASSAQLRSKGAAGCAPPSRRRAVSCSCAGASGSPGFERRHLLLSGLVSSFAINLPGSADELEFSYIPGLVNGPENWGKIKEEWATCGTGRMQSPIDLSDGDISLAPQLGYLNRSYRPAEASIVSRGHDIAVVFQGDAGSLCINGTAYHLRQLHWHTPSEHRVNGIQYSLELHMVHQSAQNKTAVIGLLYKIGRRDHFLHKLEPYLQMLADTKEKEENVGVVDPREARGEGEAYYRYMGSLTTPPCDQGVIWTVIKKVATVSSDQLKLLVDAVHDGFEMNTRPLQKVNDRDISLFYPDGHPELYCAVADH